MQKIDIKLKYNSMNIIAYMARQLMVVDAAPNPMEEFEWLLHWRRRPPGS
jgi:hypothetical protein